MSASEPAIPTIDLEDLRSGEPERRAQAVAALKLGFGHFGLVYVRNHGVDAKTLEAMYDAFLELTARSETEKKTLARTDLWYQRGWTPPNTEHAVVAGGQPDFKECYFAAPLPLDPVAAQQYPQIYAENVWPARGDALREGLTAIGQQLHGVGQMLLRACADALELPTETFGAMLDGGPHITRALRYLPLREEQLEQNILWGEEHTDFNLLTLLPGGRFLDPQGKVCARPDDQCGLYLRTRATADAPSGKMVSGAAPAGCLVAQVGQQLELLTGGTFLATPHVITAPKVSGYSRASLAHFVHVHTDQVLFPLKPFQNRATIRAYSPPVLSGTYAIKTLVDIGLAPREALDHLGYRHYDRLAEQRAQR